MFRGVKSKNRCHLDALIVGRLIDFFVLDGKFKVFDIVTQVRAVFEGHIEKDIVADDVHIVELHTKFKVFLLPDWIFFRLLLYDVHRKLGQLQVGKRVLSSSIGCISSGWIWMLVTVFLFSEFL